MTEHKTIPPTQVQIVHQLDAKRYGWYLCHHTVRHLATLTALVLIRLGREVVLLIIIAVLILSGYGKWVGLLLG